MTALKIILGIILIALGVYLVYLWYKPLLTVIQGVLGLMFIVAGLIAFALAKS